MALTTAEQIEFLCNREYPDYQAVKPERVQALLAMTMPGAGSGNPCSRGRPIPPEEQKQILEDAAAFTEELLSKPPEVVDALYGQARLSDWQADKLTLDQAAAIIAAKIFPDDGYAWTVDQRKKCEVDYRISIKELILRGSVPFVNPHTKQDFIHTRLSQDQFPSDGLLKVSNLYRCLMTDHEKKGYFPAPPARVSKAPPPITPIDMRGFLSAAATVSPPKFDKPNWARWSKLDRAHLWEASCLAADMEPPRPRGGEIGHLFELEGFPPSFFEVWEALNRDAFFSTFEKVGTCGRMLHTINLDGFAHWAMEKGFHIAPEMREIAARFGRKVQATAATTEDTKAAPQVAAVARREDKGWILQAQDVALEYIARHKAQDLFPSQEDVCSHVERELRVERVFGAHGKPVSAQYICRNAIQGAWWKLNKP